MIEIKYPSHDFKFREVDHVQQIFDEIRKTWLKLTPEEWVRQNFIQYLVQVKNIPPAYIAVEKQLKLGELVKRFDLLVYDRSHQPYMIIECKAMDIKLDEKVMEQVLRYNISIPVPFLVITNGVYCMGISRKEGKVIWLEEIPGLVC